MHGGEGVKVAGCAECRDELVAARALCRALGAAPAEVLELLQELYPSDAAFVKARTAARRRLEAQGVEYLPMAEGPSTVDQVRGVKA